MDNSYLQDLINEVNKRDGGMILNSNGHPEVVVLSVEKYNGLIQNHKNKTQNSKEHTEFLENKTTSKTVLVTGGAGYIGAHLAKQLIEVGHKVVVVDNLSAGKRENLHPEALFIEGDLKDKNLLRDIFSSQNIEVCMHLAAAIEVEESVENPEKYFQENVIGTANLLSVMAEFGVKNLVFSSTAAVYGNTEKELLSEEENLNPDNPYGYTKMLAEQLIKFYAVNFGLKAFVFRYFNACGSSFEGSVSPTHESHLIAKVMEVAKGRKDCLVVNGSDYETPDGTCVRDYVHVLDIANAHVRTLEEFNSRATGDFKIYNIGTGKGRSVLEVINSTAEVLNKMIPMEFGPRRAGDAPMSVADNSKIKQELDFEPEYSDLETIIKTCWKQVSQN